MVNNQFTNPITQEELDFIKENYYNHSIKELTVLLNKKFKKNRNYSTIKTYARAKLKLTKKNQNLDRIHNYLKENVSKMSIRQITENVNNLFNCNYSQDSIKNIAYKLNLRFYNKIGHLTKDKKPIGHEIITTNGFIIIKVAEPNKYRLKQRVVWEQYYKQEIPKDKMIIFADGDRTNCDINNLLLVDKRIPIMLTKYNFHKHSPEITKAGVTICEAQLAIKQYV